MDNELLLKQLEEAARTMHQLGEEVAKLKQGIITEPEFNQKGEKLIVAALKAHEEARHKTESKMIFAPSVQAVDSCFLAMKDAMQETDAGKRKEKMEWAMALPSKDENLEALKSVSDELLIVDAFMGAKLGRQYQGVKSLKTFQRFAMMRDMVSKAIAPMDTGDMANWIPTAVSSQLLEIPQIYGVIEPLFEHIACPTDPYNYPLDITAPTVYANLVAQTTTSTNPFDDTLGQEFTDDVMQFSAKKLRGRMIASGELTEDSIVPLVPKIKSGLKAQLDRAVEAAILSGDTTGTHMDADITDANDCRKAWIGLRKAFIAGSLNVSLSTFNTAAMRSIRAKADKYAVYPSQLAWIMGIKTYLKQVIQLAEVITVDKYGAQATLLTGELGKYDGIPIVLSEHAREDLNASGVQDGITTTRSCIILVNREYYKIGDRRNVTIEAERWLNTDQINIVAFRRLSFIPFKTPSTTYSLGAIGYNLTY